MIQPATDAGGTRLERLCKKSRDRLLETADKAFPSFGRWRRQRATVAYYRDGDPKYDKKYNEETTPPEGVEVETLCFWAIEFYMPSQIDGLHKAIERIGWNKIALFRHDHSTSDWLKKSRQSPYGGAWKNLGFIYPPGREGLLDYVECELPGYAEYASAYLYSVTPSLACIAVCFTLREEQTKQYQQALRRNYKTVPRPHKNGSTSIVDPTSLKREAIESIRKHLRNGAVSWFERHLPGVFAKHANMDQMPTIELMTISKDEPFPDRREKTRYLDVLGFSGGWDAWRSEGSDGLFFTPVRDFSNDELRHHALLIAQKERFEAKNGFEYYGGADRRGYVARVSSIISTGPSMPSLAIPALLSLFENQMASVRDQLGFRTSTRNVLKQIEELERLVADDFDIITVGRELQSAASGGFSRLWSEMDFVWASSHPSAMVGAKLKDELREGASRRIQIILSAEAVTRDLLVQFTNLVSSRRNVHLQRAVYWLTVVLVLLSILMVDWQKAIGFNPLSFLTSH